MRNNQLVSFLRYTAVAGSVLYLLLISFTGITGMKIILLGLLAFDVFLLLGRTKEVTELISFLRYVVIAGNVLFLFFILFNGINEGFRATMTEKFYYVGLMALLAFNSFLLLSSGKKIVQQS